MGHAFGFSENCSLNSSLCCWGWGVSFGVGAMSSLKRPVISDNGTGFVKCGMAGDNFPQFIFPSMIGKPLMR